MSAIIERFIICDGRCGNNFGVDFRSWSIKLIRKAAKEQGWTNKGKKDYCDECSKKKSDSK